MMVFVAHPAAGIHRVPEEWLDGFLPSGFRQATHAEIIRWHDERDLEPPEPPEVPGEPASPADGSTSPSNPSGESGPAVAPAHGTVATSAAAA